MSGNWCWRQRWENEHERFGKEKNSMENVLAVEDMGIRLQSEKICEGIWGGWKDIGWRKWQFCPIYKHRKW